MWAQEKGFLYVSGHSARVQTGDALIPFHQGQDESKAPFAGA